MSKVWSAMAAPIGTGIVTSSPKKDPLPSTESPGQMLFFVSAWQGVWRWGERVREGVVMLLRRWLLRCVVK